MTFLIKTTDKSKIFYENHSVFFKTDAGLDLFIVEDTTILPQETKLVDLDIKCQLRSIEWNPLNWIKNRSIWKYNSYLLFPRSSISKTPLRLANSIGLIDQEYKGNIKSALTNTSNKPFTLRRGERYVQLVRSNLGPIKMKIVDSLRTTQRNVGGFGSTGK